MNRLSTLLPMFFLVAVLVAPAGVAFGQTAGFSRDESPLPAPTEPVNDFAGVLSPETISALNARIREFKERTDPQVVIAVAVVRTTDGVDPFDYSLAVARGWKIGTEKDNNPGALLLIAVDDRKYFTQVSRDLEDELNDGLVGQLQRQYLVPALKRGDYDAAVTDTVAAYIDTIEGKAGTVEPRQKKKRGGNTVGSLVCFGLFLLFSLSGFARRRRLGGIAFFPGGFGGGGGFSGGGGGGWSGGGGFGGFSGGDFGGGGSGGSW